MRRIVFPLGEYKNDIQELEGMGEEAVRYSIAHGSFFGHRQVAEEWLRQKEESRREAIELESLSIAKAAASAAERAASASSEQARWAKWAAVIAMAAAIIAAKDQIHELITKYL